MSRKNLLAVPLCLALLGLGAADRASGQPVIQVPAGGDLQQAINQVPDGGIIELANGNFAAPANGFRLRNLNKGLTIRAQAGAQVVLNGQGTNRIVRYEDNGGSGLGRPVIFQDLIFQNGFSSRQSDASAATVTNGEVVFNGCTFRNNETDSPTAGGGAVRVVAGAQVTFTNCSWDGNTSSSRGGALEIVNSAVSILRNTFTGNQVNGVRTPGGAIYVLNAELDVTESRFEGNRAGYVGGAIFVFGEWQEPESTPAAHVVVTNSTFVDNQTVTGPIPTVGGAIHAEDHATLEVSTSRFFHNKATNGGAIDGYRAILEISDSIFQGNEAEADPTLFSAGGAIFASAADFADSSTNSGAINRRPGELTVRRSLLQGRFEAVGTTATQGGCLGAIGDVNRLYGQGGVAQDGTAASNQLPVILDDVVFADCDVESHATSSAFGGALILQLADLSMEDSLVIDSDAMDTNGVGGGMVVFADSVVEIDNTAFARNTAVLRGGAAAVLGSSIEVSDSFFLENEVSPGVNEAVNLSEGAAFFFAPVFPAGQPDRHRDVTGTVEDSDFINNVGVPIYDVDLSQGPINDVRYNGNRFRSPSFGGTVYIDNAVSFFGETVAELNALVVNRTNGTQTDKSQTPNQLLNNTPRAGRVVAAPSTILGLLPPGDPAAPADAFLGYAWSGPSATLAGSNLGTSTGLVAVDDPGTYNLRVGNTNVDSATVTAVTCTNGPLLCLNNDRFRISVDWRDFGNRTGSGEIVPIPAAAAADDSGLYFFFDPDNWEMLIKVLDACSFNNRFWVFSAATTNVQYTLQVTDSATGASNTYTNELGSTAPAITDTDAFATCDAASRLPPLPPDFSTTPLSPPAHRLDALAAVARQGDCTPSATELCLNQSRFRAEIEWEDFGGRTGAGQMVPLESDDSGLFYFFAEDNWEMLIKVLNGCGFNNRYWVFWAATTTVEFTLRVTDTETGNVREYFNPLRNPAQTTLDTDAFDTCP